MGGVFLYFHPLMLCVGRDAFPLFLSVTARSSSGPGILPAPAAPVWVLCFAPGGDSCHELFFFRFWSSEFLSVGGRDAVSPFVLIVLLVLAFPRILLRFVRVITPPSPPPPPFCVERTPSVEAGVGGLLCVWWRGERAGQQGVDTQIRVLCRLWSFIFGCSRCRLCYC